MCNCKSYNCPEWGGKNEEVILDCPDFISKNKESICIDYCIVHIIKHLWDNRIITLNSCCGHNRENPSVIVPQKYNYENYKKITKLIKEVDDRKFDILQWKLVKFSK